MEAVVAVQRGTLLHALRIMQRGPFFHFFAYPSGRRLADSRWVKESYRWMAVEWVGMTLDLEERNSVQDGSENPPPNSDACESEPKHNRIFVQPRKVLLLERRSNSWCK